nr:MAG TPA: hypothetical protein [Caudoviricetes sp.]
MDRALTFFVISRKKIPAMCETHDQNFPKEMYQ